MNWRPTIRMRLTLLYGGLFFVAGLLLLGITYRAIVQALPLTAIERQIDQLQARSGDQRQFRVLEAQLEERTAALRTVRERAGYALIAVSLGAMTLGWFVAGRILRPLRTITERARQASTANLTDRIDLRGPPDELHALAQTIDEMLGRLETSFESQRQFAARVSHELRTPLSIMSAAAEASTSSANVDPELADIVRRNVQRSEHLVSGLLALSRSEQPHLAIRIVDLADIAGTCLERHADRASRAGIRILNSELVSVNVRAEPFLIEQCLENLIVNAIAYNHPGGDVRLSVDAPGHLARIRIENSGPIISESEISELFMPYRRGEVLQTNAVPGTGLGLAIVRSIVHAHSATIEAMPGPDGGLSIAMLLPQA